MSYDNNYYQVNSQLSLFPPAIKHLIFINLIIALGLFSDELYYLAFEHFAIFGPESRYGQFRPWQLVTYMFMHARFLESASHVIFNMLVLWMFGQEVENRWGTRKFVFFYFFTGIGAGLVHLLVNPEGVMVGASGAVYGVLLAFGMTFPNRQVMLLFPPIPMKAKYLVTMFGVMAFLSGFGSSGDNVAHYAHLAGMVFGFFLIQFWKLKTDI